MVKKDYLLLLFFSIALAFQMISCMTHHLITESIDYYESFYDNWEDVFEEAPPVELEVLKTGEINVPISSLINLKNPAAHGLIDKTIQVFALAFLITKDSTSYLIDTGFDSSFYNHGGNIKGWFVPPDRFSQLQGEDIMTQLNERNVHIDTVFFTHLHPDHMSGAPELPDSIKFIFSKDETYINYPPFFGGGQLKGKYNLKTLDFSKASTMPILGKCIDIFGDGSLWAISTPGHSTGHISYLVKTQETIYLLTGDASPTAWGFHNGVEPGTFNTGNTKEALDSLKKLIVFADKYKEKLTVIFGHELSTAK
ncbi:MAG: MBL fold metallo-hydrolase [Spirochaetales bacterium]|nr:MBL fold metallo-hydrolase [Spirochaetales bacterium]